MFGSLAHLLCSSHLSPHLLKWSSLAASPAFWGGGVRWGVSSENKAQVLSSFSTASGHHKLRVGGGPQSWGGGVGTVSVEVTLCGVEPGWVRSVFRSQGRRSGSSEVRLGTQPSLGRGSPHPLGLHQHWPQPVSCFPYLSLTCALQGEKHYHLLPSLPFTH